MSGALFKDICKTKEEIESYKEIPKDFLVSNLCGKPQVHCECMPALGISASYSLMKIALWQRKMNVNIIWRRKKKIISYLIGVQFHIDERHSLVHTVVMFQNTIHILRDVLHDKIQKKLIFTIRGKEAML